MVWSRYYGVVGWCVGRIYIILTNKGVGVSFNQALLGKWWWKFMSNSDRCGATVIQFNYRVSN